MAHCRFRSDPLARSVSPSIFHQDILKQVHSIGQNFATYSASDSTLTLHSTPPATLSLPPVNSLFSLPSPDHESIIGVTSDFTIIQICISNGLAISSQSQLPLSSPPKIILPVDPMAWSGTSPWAEHDVLLSVSEDGQLAFWIPDENGKVEWRCTGKVTTGRTGLRMARCSSAKKSALGKASTIISIA